MNSKRSRRLILLVVGAMIGSLALTACGSSSEGGSAGGGGGEVTQDLKDVVASYQDEPTKILQTEPLSKAPDKKSVAFIVCADPTCSILGNFLKEAVENFGWDYVGINAPATDFGSAVQQAVDLDVDYIAGTGSDVATFQNAFDNAKKAGIPYFSCYSSDDPKGNENNIITNCSDVTSVANSTRALTSWIIEDSGAEASIGVVNIPEFPTVAAAVPNVKKTLDEYCDTCTSQPIDISLDQLTTGGSANAIVSFLQSNPDVNYLFLSFTGFEPGLGQALKTAGLEDVKVVGVQPQQPQVKSFLKGESAAWLVVPQEMTMWSLADSMARYANGELTVKDERKSALVPLYLMDTKPEAEAIAGLPDGWPGPDGFQDQYRTLWGLN